MNAQQPKLDTHETRQIPRVEAAIHPTIKRFLENKDMLLSLVDGMGSPLNIIFPDHIVDNINGFEKIYKDRHLRGHIFYTSKPNKSLALKRRATTTQAGLDVSSLGELKKGLAAGFHPSRIEATGPKSHEYLFLCVQQDVLINVDNIGELQQIIALHQSLSLSRKIRIMMRLDGFEETGIQFTKRDRIFGVYEKDFSTLLDTLINHQDILDFYGFSFHLSASDFNKKIPAISQTLALTFQAIERGLSPKGINIGGGYRCNYVRSEDEWDDFMAALKTAAVHGTNHLTWDNGGMGYYSEDGVLKGRPRFADPSFDGTGADDLARLLDTPLPAFDNQTTASLLSDSMLELYIEPGRSALDQCGITAARVNGVKTSKHGENLILLDMNPSNINATMLPYMMDPIVISRNGTPPTNEQSVIYMGNLCLTQGNIIMQRKTKPATFPQIGDDVVFVNTAAYQMDFVETEFLQQRIAEKIAVTQTEENNFTWVKDELYTPFQSRLGENT